MGGTSRCSNVPDMESLPPMAATPSSICARSAPNSAASGRPQRSASCPGLGKNSWKDRYASRWLAPAATKLATDSTTLKYAPW